MLRQRGLRSLIVALGLLAVCSGQGHAQQVRYMDSSGNIHFVDSLSQVPPRYREQIVPATPTPVLDRRGVQAKKRAEAQAAREKQMEERRKQNELRRKQREQQMAEMKERKRLQRERNESSFSRE